MEALPDDIRNLPQYYVPNELFVCTAIVLIFFMLWAVVMFVVWAWRSKKHIHNYQYVVDHNIRRQYEHAKKTYKERMQREREEENEVLQSQVSESNVTHYSPQLEAQQLVYNRQQSRMLQFLCLSVVVIIHVNAFVCNIMEVAAFFIALVVFLVFNVFKVVENEKLRLLFLIPLLIAYIPFFVFDKSLDQR